MSEASDVISRIGAVIASMDAINANIALMRSRYVGGVPSTADATTNGRVIVSANGFVG